MEDDRWNEWEMESGEDIKSFDFVQNFAIIFVQNITSKIMTTEMISLSEYRKNISTYTRRANEQNVCFIITSHGKPIWEYKPLTQKDIKITTKYSQDFINELEEIEKEPTLTDLDTVFARLLK